MVADRSRSWVLLVFAAFRGPDDTPSDLRGCVWVRLGTRDYSDGISDQSLSQEETSMGKTVHNPPTLCRPFGIFSNAVLAGQGRMCFISGQVAIDAEGRLVGKGDIRLQTRQVLHNILAALKPVGGTLEDIACVNVFLVNMEHLKAVHEVRAEFWSADYPASTLVRVAGLVHPDYLIEINATAVISDQVSPAG